MADESDDTETGGGDETVPRRRLNAEIAKRKDLEARLAVAEAGRKEAETKLTTAETTVSTLTAKVSDLETTVTRAEVDRTLADAGITDPEGRGVALYLHGSTPEKERKPLAEWLASLKAEGAAVPRALAPYLGGASDGATAAPVAAPVAGASGVKAAPPTTGAPSGRAITPDAIRAAYAKASALGGLTTDAGRAAVAEVRAMMAGAGKVAPPGG
jgi:hypothetical protein